MGRKELTPLSRLLSLQVSAPTQHFKTFRHLGSPRQMQPFALKDVRKAQVAFNPRFAYYLSCVEHVSDCLDASSVTSEIGQGGIRTSLSRTLHSVASEARMQLLKTFPSLSGVGSQKSLRLSEDRGFPFPKI